MQKWGYAWESHSTVTQDGWELTLFRITGGDSGLDEKSGHFKTSKYSPILFQHDSFSDAET